MKRIEMYPVPVLMMAAAMFKINSRIAKMAGDDEDPICVGVSLLKVHGIEYRIEVTGAFADVIYIRQRDEYETTDWCLIDGELHDAYELVIFVDEAEYLV